MASNTNLFASTGVTDYNTVNAAVGKFMKAEGVTVCGAVGYPNATAGPSAVHWVKAVDGVSWGGPVYAMGTTLPGA